MFVWTPHFKVIDDSTQETLGWLTLNREDEIVPLKEITKEENMELVRAVGKLLETHASLKPIMDGEEPTMENFKNSTSFEEKVVARDVNGERVLLIEGELATVMVTWGQ